MRDRWSIGAKIWFAFYIFCQWVMFIEYATKPATAYSPALQRATIIYGVAALIATALILWLAIGHKRAALYTMIAIAVVNAAILLIQGSLIPMLASLVMPTINWLIARYHVE